MKTELKQYSIAELCDGFVYNELEEKGLYGLSGRLTIQPEYQRNYLYAEDNGKQIRLSHENPDIKKLYAEYLGEPGSEKAHHLLHTVYHENLRG